MCKIALLKVLVSYYSHVVIGDHSLRTDPDCSNGDCTQRAQNIPIDFLYKHENYNKNSFQKGFDIALIRLRTPAKMFIVRHEL